MRPAARLRAAVLLCAVAAVTTAARLPYFSRRRRRRSRALTADEAFVDESIAATMPPAEALGIEVEALDAASGALSLRAPLAGNTNVHGTAFAGSLYSIAALCAWCGIHEGEWKNTTHATSASGARANKKAQRRPSRRYTLFMKLRALGLDREHAHVIQSAEIAYSRPVTEESIVARSELPAADELARFFDELAAAGKASVVVRGKIMKSADKPAVAYSVKLCAFKKRAPAAAGK